MKRRLSFLLAGVMALLSFAPLNAYDINTTCDSIPNTTQYARTTVGSLVTTGGSITTGGGIEVGGGNSISYYGLEKDSRFGFRDKVITTDRGTIEIMEDGSIVTTGETTYNPQTGNFDVIDYDYERIFVGGHIEGLYGELYYGKGSVVTRDFTFIYKDEVYAISKGDIYTRWFKKGDDVNTWNIMPLFSFMQIDNKWVFFDSSTILWRRYTNTDSISEIVASNKATVRLEEDMTVRDISSTTYRTIDQYKIIPAGCLLVVGGGGDVEWMIQRGSINKGTVINYPDGSVELIKKDMAIVDTNVAVGIQNYRMDNIDIAFRSFRINIKDGENGEEEEKPPVIPPVITPPIYNDDNSSTSGSTVVDTSQKLDKKKQYEYEVTSKIKLSTKDKTIELVKGDRIILPNYTEKIDKVLPVNTLIIKSDGGRIVLKESYTMNTKVTFKASKERYFSFVLYLNSKPYNFVFRLA